MVLMDVGKRLKRVPFDRLPMVSVSLHHHDVAWGERLAREREHVEVTVPVDCTVFHIGSTAIPDTPTKSTLDAVGVVADKAAMDPARDALLEDGYGSHRNDPEWKVLTRSRDAYGVCLHLRPRAHPRWRDQLVFREYLRDEPRARARYERVKRAAAAAHGDDVSAYTDAKESVILRLVEEAYERGYGERLRVAAPGD
jgi:GrpB-like predicted nucleotidyltransferase (UPF0157 family)